ncbi:Ig-like domain-containing protein [Ichthyenterobacterium sp. W332]|uniref:Ig-like domain-containing protein n=1 Tax=Microcosmobacter mediterraneus TaxID=3075607 RepID=A0ABU2YL24_9FLAO|nr:Ig-like domain-containing protein [Ichthyenterobacterium sp. W332]MDT0558858.1 Ig-like domain-containing protein [Ichthyenterobacterium sp. W332]
MRVHLTILLLFVSLQLFANDFQIVVNEQKVTFYDASITIETATVYYLLKNNKLDENNVVRGVFKKNVQNVTFVPEFPFLQNVIYVLKYSKGAVEFSIPTENKNKPIVTQVYPTSNKLPVNLLRMYIQFSKPMKTINNLKHIKLFDAAGEEVKGVIFNNVYELWNDAQTQLTIIFDPARVKTGLIANEQLGRVLKPNQTYHLVINNLQDVYGNSLKEPYTKTFSVIKEDIVSPDTDLWNILLPSPNNKIALQVDFGNSIDMMSLLHRIRIYNSDNEIIKVSIHIGQEEKSIKFIQEEKWVKGNYTLKINSRLSDPSGNNLNGLFDHAIGSLKNKQEGKIISLPITIH